MITNWQLHVTRFLESEEAATSVEYAVMLMLIAGICISVIQAMGGSTSILWSDTADDLEGVFAPQATN